MKKKNNIIHMELTESGQAQFENVISVFVAEWRAEGKTDEEIKAIFKKHLGADNDHL